MTILYSNDFDNATSLNFTKSSSPTNPSISSDFAYGGSGTSLKCVIPAMVNGLPVTNDPNHYRAEVNSFDIHGSDEYMTPGQVYKFGFAIYIPSDFNPSTQGEILWQLHHHPVPSSLGYKPPTRHFNIRADGLYARETRIAGYTKGAWLRVYMELRPSAGSDGYWKIRLDGTEVHAETGSNAISPTYNGSSGYRPFVKMGIYAWVRKTPTNSSYPGSSTSELVLYFDKLKIGDEAATFADVDPGAGAGTGTPPSVTYIPHNGTAPINSRFVSGSSSFGGANFDAAGIASISGYTVGGQFGTVLTANINTGATSEIWASLTNDTTLETEKVLEVGIAQPHATEGNQRVQFGMSMSGSPVLKFRYKLWLHPDVGLLRTYNGTYDWFAISSVFSDNTWSSTHPFVMSVDIAKQSAAVPSDLKWRVRGRTYSYPGYSPNSDLWEVFSTQAIEVGKWMLVEHEIIDGTNTTGRYKIFITPEGGTRTQVIDVTNWTRHPSKPGGTGPTALTPIKFYTGTAQINHVKNNGGKLVAQFDDVQAFASATDVAWPTSEGTTITLKTGGGGTESGNPQKITSINTTDIIEPNTQNNVVIGTLLSGVYAAEISDSDTTITEEAIGFPTGTEARFRTGALTGISTPATVKLLLATPHYYDDNPRKPWANNGSSYNAESNYATVVGPFAKGVTLSSNGDNAGKITEPILTASEGDNIEVVFFYASGTSPNIIAFIGRTGTLDRVQVTGTQGSANITSDTLSTGDAAITQGTSLIYPSLKWIKLTFTIEAGYTDQVFLGGIGPYSTTSGHTIHVLGTLVFKNKVTGSVTKLVTIPSLAPTGNPAPTISSVTSLTSGSTFTITGTGLKATAYINITGGASPVPVHQYKVNSAGTEIVAVAPYGLPETGASLELTWSPRATFEAEPLTWTDNAGGALQLTAYPTSTWAGDAGAIVSSAGVAWHRTTKDMIYAGNNDNVVVKINYIRGSSPNATFGVRNAAENSTLAIGGSQSTLAIGNNSMGQDQTFTDAEIGGVRQMTINFTNVTEGQISVGIGPNSEFEDADIVVISQQAYSTVGVETVTSAVTVASGLSKKIAFTGDNTLYCRSAAAGNASAYSSAADGDIYIIIGSGNPRPSPGGQFPTILAYATNATIVDGEYVLDDAELEYGSINALETGDQGYYMWASNASGSCRWSAPVQVIAE